MIPIIIEHCREKTIIDSRTARSASARARFVQDMNNSRRNDRN